MKKIYTLLLLALSLNSYSQVWIDQNATWHYDYWNIAEQGFYRIEYNQDTLLGGENCQMMEAFQSKFVTDQFGEMHHIGPTLTSTNYTYVNGDTVFYWRDNQFYTLFNFGALIGDQWLIGSDNIYSTDNLCNDSSFVEVIDTGSVTINSNQYRTISLASTEGSYLQLAGIFVERFGLYSASSGNHIFPTETSCDTTISWHPNYYTFKCFEDDSFTLHNPSGEDCEYLLTHLSVDEIALKQILTYPNPTTETLTIDVIGEGELKLFNVSGQLILQQNHKDQSQLDLGELPSGVYLLRFNNGSISITEKVIKN